MTTSHWCRLPSEGSSDLTTDVLILGGGYVGLSTAFWLTEINPELQITLVDRQQVGAGASGRNAGFLTKGSAAFYRTLIQTWGLEKALEIYKFAEESLSLVEEKILRKNPGLQYEKTTSLTLFTDSAMPSLWEREKVDLSPFKFNWVEAKALPHPLSEKFCGGFENGPEYKINPLQLLESLKKILESRKVRIIEGVSAFRMTDSGVITEVNRIKADKVVLALNAYLPQFHQAFKELVFPHLAQMLAVKVVGDLPCPSLHYDPADRVYWRKSGDDLLLIGGKRLLDAEGEQGDFERVSPIIQDGLEEYLREKLGLKYEVVHRWSGIMGFTRHELPVINRLDASVESFVIGGFSGHGMGLGFRSAMDLAEVICGKKENSYFSGNERIKIAL